MGDAAYRLEVKLPRELKHKLEKLRFEASEKTGTKIAMSALIEALLQTSLEKIPLESLADTDSAFFLLLSSS